MITAQHLLVFGNVVRDDVVDGFGVENLPCATAVAVEAEHGRERAFALGHGKQTRIAPARLVAALEGSGKQRVVSLVFRFAKLKIDGYFPG